MSGAFQGGQGTEEDDRGKDTSCKVGGGDQEEDGVGAHDKQGEVVWNCVKVEEIPESTVLFVNLYQTHKKSRFSHPNSLRRVSCWSILGHQ